MKWKLFEVNSESFRWLAWAPTQDVAEALCKERLGKMSKTPEGTGLEKQIAKIKSGKVDTGGVARIVSEQQR